MRGAAGRTRGAGMLAWIFRLALLFTLCAALYLYAQRRRIADHMIRRELHGLGVSDLEFTLCEISPFRFELSDISWGARGEPFLYVASAKAGYRPLRLLRGALDTVEFGHVALRARPDAEGRMRVEALERAVALAERCRIRYAPQGGGGGGEFALPALMLSRLTVAVENSEGFQTGAAEISATVAGSSGYVTFSGYGDLPDGRKAGVRGTAKLRLPEPLFSALHAQIAVALPLRPLLPAAVSVAPETLELRGDLVVQKRGSEVAWSLDFTRMEAQPFRAGSEGIALEGHWLFGVKLDGTATNVWGSCGVALNDLVASFKDAPAEMALTNRVQSVVLNMLLPETRLDRIGGADMPCKGYVHNLDLRIGELLAIEGARFETEFSISTNGVAFRESDLSWTHCTAGGVTLEPAAVRIAASSGSLRVEGGAGVPGDDLTVALSAAIPLGNPRSAALSVRMPPVRLSEKSRTAKRLRRHMPKDSEFSGVLSAEAELSLAPSGVTGRGLLTLEEGSFRREELRVEGVGMELPFAINGGLRSRGNPRLEFATLTAGNISMTDGEVLFHILEDEALVESASIGWAGGFLRAYSVHAGFDGAIRNEFTIYADRIDLGGVLGLLMPFSGTMQGVLYGRFPVRLRNQRVALSSGFLYSLPGQGGYLKIREPGPMEALLKRAGIRRDADEIARALCDLDLASIRLDFDPRGGGDSSLRVRLAGKSNYEKRPAPVDLNLNFNGPLEEILNLGMDVQRFKSR